MFKMRGLFLGIKNIFSNYKNRKNQKENNIDDSIGKIDINKII